MSRISAYFYDSENRLSLWERLGEGEMKPHILYPHPWAPRQASASSAEPWSLPEGRGIVLSVFFLLSPRFFIKFTAFKAAGLAVAAIVLWTIAGCSAQKSTPDAGTLERELWDVCFVQGARIGYMQTSYYRTTDAGKAALRIEGVIRLTIQRFGQESTQEISCTSIETPEGQLLGFQSEINPGPQSMRTTGRVVDKRLNMETISQGKKTAEVFDWSPEYGGFYAVEQSLERKPMQPGERRTLHALITGFNQVATIEMFARDWEQVALMHGNDNLLRIDMMVIFPNGQQLEQTAWSNRAGEVLKTRSLAMDMETLRASKTEAMEKTETAQVDIGLSTTVKLDKPLPSPHDTKKVVYRVQLEGSDPAAVFVTGPTQKVKSVDANTVEITVYAVRPDQPGNLDASADPPTADDSESNNWIQSDNPKIAALAKEAAGDETDPWRTAVKLEQFVHSYIKEKDFSQAFATAAEVADTREGDCTEHAMLLAALCRARGIPARVAIGLVYMPSSQAFGYHMWTEVYFDNKSLSPESPLRAPRQRSGEGQGEGISSNDIPPDFSFRIGSKWIPIDATLGKGGIGAAHLKLAHSNLKGASAYSSFLPVVQVVGRLKIEVVEAE